MQCSKLQLFRSAPRSLLGRARWARQTGREEIGGPPVVASGKASYGTSTIRDVILTSSELAREGVRCCLELPADWQRNDEPRWGDQRLPAP